jgi:hypothetical protein
MTLSSRPLRSPVAFSKALFRRSSAASRSGLETWIPVPVGNLDLEGSVGARDEAAVFLPAPARAPADHHNSAARMAAPLYQQLVHVCRNSSLATSSSASAFDLASW